MKKIKYFFWLIWLCSQAQAQNTFVTKLCFFNEDVQVQATIEPFLKDSIRMTLRVTNQTRDTIAIDGQMRLYFYKNLDSTMDISGDFFGIRACYESYHSFQKLAPHQTFELLQKRDSSFGALSYKKVNLELMYVKNIAECIEKKWFIQPRSPKDSNEPIFSPLLDSYTDAFIQPPSIEDSNKLLFPLNEKLDYKPLKAILVGYDPKTKKTNLILNCQPCDKF
jgi:hypothetical protein